MANTSRNPTEEIYPIAIGQGMYTSELSTNIPDGFSPICYNLVATGDSLENRIGIRQSSVTWKVQEYSPGHYQSTADDYHFFVHLFPWAQDSTKPAIVWGGKGISLPTPGSANSPTLNLIRAYGTSGSGDGFMSVVTASEVLGAATYGETWYFSLRGAGIRKVSSIDWSADTVTHSHVVSSGTGTLKGLFTFKDRMWGWGGTTSAHRLYFTDIAALGGFPETWAFATNFVQFSGPNGFGAIKKVIPLGNRLLIFTDNGLFTLLVEGAPASWILRLLDSKSVSTTSQCAFESKGIVYFVNTQGVWATDGRSITKLSAVIDDQWYRSKGPRVHTICPYEDGMIVSIAKQAPVNGRTFDKNNSQTFYSKLDPIGWTEWNINKYMLGAGTTNLAMFWSTTDKIPTYLNSEPTVYTMAYYSNSIPGAEVNSVLQLQVLDGGTDEYYTIANTLTTDPVGVYLKTKHFDGGNQFSRKYAKVGMIEVFTSDAEHEFETSWDNDFTTDEASEISARILNDFSVGNASNLIRLKALFWYRRAALNFRAELQAADSQIKIKNVALVQDTGRQEFEQVQ